MVLLDSDSIIAEKTVKVKTGQDNCFYAKTKFYLIPILPILWFYANEQICFNPGKSSLIIEYSINRGAAVIIGAGGSVQNNSWEFEKRKH